MTLLLVLLYASASWYARIPASALAVAALLYAPLRSSRWMWLAITAVVATGIVRDWFLIDNHKYLLGYWCLAVVCGLHCSDREAALARSARALIGLTFLCAVIWKLRSADFMDCSYFQYALLFDPRFAFFATSLGGASDVVMELDAAGLGALVSYDSVLTQVPLVVPAGVQRMAGLMTSWTLLIEAGVALAFLLPARSSFGRRRDGVLLAFVTTTFLMAPVIGFGWVLAVMGLAQCDPRRRRLQAAYVALFVALILYRMPWKAVLAGLAG